MGKKPVRITKEQSVRLEHELLTIYSGQEFQRNLHALWNKADNPLEQGKARQAACLPAQLRVIPKYGFEASRLGVVQSVNAYTPYNHDVDEMVRAGFFFYLVNPGHQKLVDDPNLNLSGLWKFVGTEGGEFAKVWIEHSTGDPRFYGQVFDWGEIKDGRLCGCFGQWRIEDVRFMLMFGRNLPHNPPPGYMWKESGEILGLFHAFREEVPHTENEQEEEAKAKEEAEQVVLLEHLDQECPLIYGGLMAELRAPSVFLRARAVDESAALMEYIRQDPEGPFAGTVDEWPRNITSELPGRWGKWKFNLGGEQEPLLKADWHSVHNWGFQTSSFVPRAADICFLKRAPRRLLAFIECFREVNIQCWTNVLRELEDLKHEVDTHDPDFIDLPWLVDLICKVMRKRGHFGAMEAQVWWGPQTITTRSHKDGATSLLHLSLTLSGHRCVRVGGFDNALAPMVRDLGTRMRVQENVWDEMMWYQGFLRTVALRPGAVYCSAPFVFEHGVEYIKCVRDNPVIAVQCRFAFSDLPEATRVNTLRNGAMRAVTTAIARTIKDACDRGEMRMPTLEEVKLAERNIAFSEAKFSSGRHEDCLFQELPPSTDPAAQ